MLIELLYHNVLLCIAWAVAWWWYYLYWFSCIVMFCNWFRYVFDFWLSLDPDDDPMCVLLMIDFYALRAEQYAFLIRMFDEWEVGECIYFLLCWFCIVISNTCLTGWKLGCPCSFLPKSYFKPNQDLFSGYPYLFPSESQHKIIYWFLKIILFLDRGSLAG